MGMQEAHFSRCPGGIHLVVRKLGTTTGGGRGGGEGKPGAVEWEKNVQNNLSPRADLNLKLMDRRILPSLNLAIVIGTKPPTLTLPPSAIYPALYMLHTPL